MTRLEEEDADEGRVPLEEVGEQESAQERAAAGAATGADEEAAAGNGGDPTREKEDGVREVEADAGATDGGGSTRTRHGREAVGASEAEKLDHASTGVMLTALRPTRPMQRLVDEEFD